MPSWPLDTYLLGVCVGGVYIPAAIGTDVGTGCWDVGTASSREVAVSSEQHNVWPE